MSKTKNYRRTYTQIEQDILSQSKVCSQCKIRKSFDDFNQNKSSPDIKKSICRECVNECKRQYVKNNREKVLLNGRKWRKNNPELSKASIRRANKQHNLKKQTDPLYKARFNLSQNLRNHLHKLQYNDNRKKCKTFQMLGYTKQDFYDKMSKYLNKPCERCQDVIIDIDNLSIDHIIPSCTAKTFEDIVKLNQLDNLRLICLHCNIVKNDNIE